MAQVSVTVGSAIGGPNAIVALDISIASTGQAMPAVVQITLDWDPGIVGITSAVLGPVGVTAGKTLVLSGNIVLIYGINQNIIADGVLATISFQLPAVVVRSAVRAFSLAGDTTGQPIPTVYTPGAVTPAIAPGITCPLVTTGVAGTPFSAALIGVGGQAPLFYTIPGALPAGLALDPLTGIISGTPTAAGTTPFTATVTDALGLSSSAACSITISGVVYLALASAVGAPSAIVPLLLSIASAGGAAVSSIECTFGYSTGVSSIASATIGAAGSAAVKSILLGGNTLLIYGVNQNIIGDGALATVNFQLPAISVPGTIRLMGAVASDALGNAIPVITTDGAILRAPAPTLACPPIRSTIIGVAYAQSMTASGGLAPYAWTVIAGALPPGLALGNLTGAITGTATAGGAYNFTAQVTDANGQNGTAVCTILVTGVATLLMSSAVGRAGGTVDLQVSLASTGGAQPSTIEFAVIYDPGQATLATARAGPSSFAASKDLLLSGSTLLLYGVNQNIVSDGVIAVVTFHLPAVITTVAVVIANVVVSDKDGNPIATAAVAGGITVPTQPTSTCVQGAATLGVPFTQTLVVTGGTPPYALQLAGGAFPPGLALNAAVISGTPTVIGLWTYAVSVLDALGQGFLLNCSIGVAPPSVLPRVCSQFSELGQPLVAVYLAAGS